MTTEDKIDILHTLIGVCIRMDKKWWGYKKNIKVVIETKVYKFSDILLDLIQRYRWITHQKLRQSSLSFKTTSRLAISPMEAEMFNSLYRACIKCIGKEKTSEIMNRKIDYIIRNMQYED